MICCIASCSMTRNLAGKQCSSPSLCCMQGILFPCAESLPRLVQQPLSPLQGQPEPFRSYPQCKRQRSSDSFTSNFAHPFSRTQGSRISCVTWTSGGFPANPLRLAFRTLNFKPIFQTDVRVSLKGPSRSEPLKHTSG